MKDPKTEFHIVDVKNLLKEALPPQADPVYWRHATLDRAITGGSITMISSDSASKSLQLSLEIAATIARTNTPVVPTRGLNPFTGVNESESYDESLAEAAKPMPVLYLNTIATDAQLERELVLTLPDMLKWIWIDREHGTAYPYEEMRLHQITAQPGTIMKEEHKRTLMQFVGHNKIKFIVLNSFEFACRTQRERDDLACMLKELRDTHNVAILVFTQEAESRLKRATRGPLAMIAMLSSWIDSIATLAPDLKDRTIEYVAPATDAASTAPRYRDAVEINDSLKQTSTDVIVELVTEGIEIPSGMPTDVGKLTQLNYDVIRNGGDVGTVKKSL
jgi:hypothetical protein